MQYIRLSRELEIQNILYQFLFQQFEQAKIQEAKDTPVIIILSRASVPELKHRPKKAIVTAIAVAAAFLLTIIVVIFAQMLSNYKSRNKEDYDKLSSVYKDTIGDLQFWKRKRSK